MSRKPKVALLFGNWLVAGQMSAFKGLDQNYDLTLFLWDANNAAIDALNFKKRKVRSIDSYLPDAFIITRGMKRLVTKYRYDNTFAPDLTKQLKEFDLIYTSETYTSWTHSALAAANEFRCKTIIQCYENLPFIRQDPRATTTRVAANRSADHFVAATNQARDVLIAEGANSTKISVIPPAVDTANFCPSEKNDTVLRSFGCSADDFVVVYIGRLLWVKGIIDLATAANIVVTQSMMPRTKVKFLIAGAGPCEQLLRSYIQHYGIDDVVKMVGRIPHNRTVDFYNIADVVVVPSLAAEIWEEQFGLVLAESMACGKPVVSTNTGAIPEVTGGFAHLVPNHSPMQLAEAIRDVLINKGDVRDSARKSRLWVEQNYSVHEVSKKLDQLFQTVLNN